MAELNDKKQTGALPEQGESGVPSEERIAPASPRSDAGEPSQNKDDAQGRQKAEAGEPGAEAGTAPTSKRRPSAKALVAGIAACAVVVCAAVAGAGYAAGWFGGADADQPSSQQTVAASAPGDSSKGSAESAESGSKAAGSESSADKAADDSQSPESDQPVQPQPSEEPSSGAASADAGSAQADATAANPQAVATPEVAPAPEPAPQPQPTPEPPAPSTITVSVHVDSSRAASKGYPASMASGSVTLNQGASVYDALCALGVSVGGSSNYVTSINGLAEFACGSGSGWLYLVNGSSPGYGCGSYILQGGESITWVYTCDMGNDL